VIERKQDSLGSFLRSLIDDAVDEDRPREEVIDDIMAQSGGMDRSTINSIIEGRIECPPRERFSAFAEVLDNSVSELVDVATEANGCEFDTDQAMSTDAKLRERLREKIAQKAESDDSTETEATDDDPDDPEDMEDLMNLIAVIASERVAMDDFDVTTAEQMTVADLTALVQAVLPGGNDE